ncbi:MAG: GatB/YqeY domain-containing protein [Candidatus Komeilibacteria bacterium]
MTKEKEDKFIEFIKLKECHLTLLPYKFKVTSMSLAQQIKDDFITAFKDKQDTAVSVLRMLKSSLTNKEIEKKLAKGKDLPDEEIIAVIKSEVKKRKDSYLAYTQADRQDLADKEQKEIKILNKYLPEQMSEDKVREAVVSAISKAGATSSADFGKVMGAVMGKLGSQVDGQVVSKILKEQLK